MSSLSASRLIACIAMGFGCLLICAAPVRGQSFVEFGGGWNYLAPAPAGDNYSRGVTFRASIGRVFAPNFRVRLDAFMIRFDHNLQYYPPCAPPGCARPYYNVRSNSVVGLTANGLVNVDPRGTIYVIGGAGLYHSDVSSAELHLGGSVGAGIAMPVGARLRAVVEARWHGLLGTTAGPSWLVPVTIGFRY